MEELCIIVHGGSVVVSAARLARHHSGFDPRSDQACSIRCKTWLSTLEIMYLTLCLSDETLKRRWFLLSSVCQGKYKIPRRESGIRNNLLSPMASNIK